MPTTFCRFFYLHDIQQYFAGFSQGNVQATLVAFASCAPQWVEVFVQVAALSEDGGAPAPEGRYTDHHLDLSAVLVAKLVELVAFHAVVNEDVRHVADADML